MKQTQKFGGEWTIEKLSILSDYLDFYLNALKNQPFKKVYIDAFAGSGEIETRDGTEQITGSIRLALQAKNKFDRYIFIEKNEIRSRTASYCKCRISYPKKQGSHLPRRLQQKIGRDL